MRIQLVLAVLVVVATGCSLEPAQAQFDVDFEIERVFPNLNFDGLVDLQHAGDGTNRLFVIEKEGVVRVFPNDPDVTSAAQFLDITDRVNEGGGEEGLLGLAFHPDYENNGFFYVNYTASNPRRSVISRFQADPNNANQANAGSELVLLEVNQPFSNHNGGQLAFNPHDSGSYLYIALGDGGAANDPQNHGQNLTSLLGAILRIDVDNPASGNNYGIPADNPFAGNSSGFREEIYAYGLRNPWRFSFDSQTGELWTGDVGQNDHEEIDLVVNGGNYGWRIMEGFHCFSPPAGCDQTDLILPIVEYSHPGRQAGSVTGGHVYRGPGVPELTGHYIYADYIDGRTWALNYDGSQVVNNTEIIDAPFNISAFGVDEANELYICDFGGRIYRFVPTVNTNIEVAELPESPHALRANHPNPFQSITTIPYMLDALVQVDLAVYDVLGRRVRTLTQGMQAAGDYSVQWDGLDEQGNRLTSGMYLLRLLVDGSLVGRRSLVLTN